MADDLTQSAAPLAQPEEMSTPQAMPITDSASPVQAPAQAPGKFVSGAPVKDAGIAVYDISGETPVLGSLSPEEVTQAVASGNYSLPKGSRVPVVSPDGEHGDLDPVEAAEAFRNGYKFLTPADLKAASYSTTGQQIITGLEGAGRGLAGPLADAFERGLGVPAEDIRGREEANPTIHALAETGAFAGSMLLGVGEAGLVAKAGNVAAKALKVGEEAGAASKIAGGAVKLATEMGLLQAGDETSKMITGDPNQTAESAASAITLAGLMGGVGGGALGAVSPIWKATVGNKAGQIIEDFKSRMKFHLDNPELTTAVGDELQNHYTTVKSLADEVYGPTGLKAQDILKSVPELNPKISSEMQNISENLQKQITKMNENPYRYPPRLASQLQEDSQNFLDVVTRPGATSGDLFNAAQDLKQTFQGYSKYEKFVKPVDEAYNFVRDSKDIAFKLRNSLENPEVWGKAAERQKTINGAFADFLPKLKDFEKKFTTEVAGERVIDPSKVNTYVSQLGKPNAELKKEMVKNFLDAAEHYKKVISDTHANLGLTDPLPHSSTALIRHTLEETTSGAKLADLFVKKGIVDLTGEGTGAAIGAMFGKSAGMEGIGALIGAQTLGPFFKSVLPALVKPMLESANNATGLKAAIDYGMAVVKGEAEIAKVSKSLFKSGVELFGPDAVSPGSRKKLEKALDHYENNPQAMLEVGGQVGHYLPQHNTAMGDITARATQYLNSLKPGTARGAPFDAPSVPTEAEKSAYNRALDLAQKPLLIARNIKDGTITPQDITTVKTIYPSLYTKLSQKFMNDAIEHMSKEDSVPYKTRLGLSLFLGQPLDSTMSAASIMAAQPILPPPQQQSGVTRKKKNTAPLSKMHNMYKTPGQSAEEDRSGRE